MKNVGKNLFDGIVESGEFTSLGDINANPDRIYSVNYIKVEPNTQYVANKQINRVCFYDAHKKFLNRSSSFNFYTFTTPVNGCFVRFDASTSIDISSFQLEKGSTSSAYEPYTGEPEMLCDEEALVAYLSGVTDTYPEEIKDPYDVRIVGYLRHLASIRWPEPDYPVNNEEFYLSTMEPTHTSNPEPSSDIELDTVDGKIISVEAYGDTTQQTYSGKNLAPLLPDGTITTSQTLTNGVITIKQLYSYNKVLSCQNGVINGKPLENTGTYYIWTYTVTGLKPNTAYTVSSDFSATMAAVGNVIVFNIVYSNLPIGTTTGRVVAYRTTDENGNLSAQQVINVSINNGQTTAISLSNIQIEEGATATPYEPFVGGMASPNPQFPQPVQTVTGTQAVSITDGTNTQNFTVDLGSIELCKLGGYQDYIYKSGDDWYVHKAVGKVVYNGSEDWGLWSASAEQPRRLGLRDTTLWFKGSMMLASNYFIRTTYSESQTDLTIWTQTQYLAITDKNSYWSSYTDFKTWLSTHNLIVYYELRTPTDTKITDATLVGQLEALAGADTYNEKTFIKVTANDPNLPALLKVEAYKY